MAILDLRIPNRKLKLIAQHSRALKEREIHELIVTKDPNAGPGGLIDSATYVCFFEVFEGGVALVGDKILIGGSEVGELIGFDETHFPNHLNIVMLGKYDKTGRELNLRLEDEVVIGKSLN
ncbi:MAG: hypothetical protein QW371_03805 [Candidatus Bathyarchaeia archaeon]